MSGLEVLGAVASTAQLLTYIITVSSSLGEVRYKIRNALQRLQQYNRQSTELVAITEQLMQNPPVRNKEFDVHVETLSSKVTAIRAILTDLNNLSRKRQRWNMMSSDLPRQLDEYFRDARNTMGNLIFLIVSQNAHDQKELMEHVQRQIGVAELSTKAANSTPSLLCPAKNNSTRRDVGSHSFQGLVIRDNATVSIGNVSAQHNTLPNMPGHSFTDFEATGNGVLHIGNIGGNSEGHVFNNGVIEKNRTTIFGDYADLDRRFREFYPQWTSTTSKTCL
ncbi:hypothetical protein F4777DRAFT_575590 [Nemania sp. FL0916]|nr:hypothetical protein F4777DRAFT_575590 [Nemania sp. FL0916]